MRKLFRKAVAATLCVTFFASQATFANSTGQVLKPSIDGTGGANIISSQGGFTGFTNPLFGKDKNNATLNFNGDAVINWGQLNVGSNQSLHFANGNYVVLNNVLNGMSTFAGKVTGEQGKIIISNPNGMIMQGGQFETAGSLVLTTKDLTGIGLSKFHNIDEQINNASYKNNNAVIVFKNGNWTNSFRGSSIEAGDINIIAKGIDITQANLVANKGNVVLKTTDGANFVAESANKTFGTNFTSGNTIQVATTAIKTKNGGLQLITDKGNVLISSPVETVKIVNSDVKGNLSVKSNVHIPDSLKEVIDILQGKNDLLGDIIVNDSQISGKTDLVAWGDVIINNSKLGDACFKSVLKGINVANSEIKGDAAFDLPTIVVKGFFSDHTYWEHDSKVVSSNTAIDGNITLNVAKDAEFTSPNNLHFVNPNVGGILKAFAQNTLSFTKKGSDLNINQEFNNKYQVSAGDELQFITDKNLKAENQTFNTRMTSFTGNTVTLNNINTPNSLGVYNSDNIYITNCSSDKLAIVNAADNKFSVAKIIKTNANETKFENGKYLYIDLTDATLFNNDRDAIKGSANNVDEIVIVPELVLPPVDPEKGDNNGGNGDNNGGNGDNNGGNGDNNGGNGDNNGGNGDNNGGNGDNNGGNGDNTSGMPEKEENTIASDYIDPTLSQESTKIMNNMRMSATDVVIGENIQPIAFAAYETNKKGSIYKAAGDKIFADLNKIIHITDRFNLD